MKRLIRKMKEKITNMKTAIFEFLISALPWIAIGIFVACSCVIVKTKKDGKEISSIFKGICWLPALCFLVVAIMEMLN